MELKVWVEGIQRIVCGVTEKTTCQDVVYALAHATGKTGRFTLIKRWHNKERLLAPQELPLEMLTNCGDYSQDVEFFLQRSALDVKSSRPAAVTYKPGEMFSPLDGVFRSPNMDSSASPGHQVEVGCQLNKAASGSDVTVRLTPDADSVQTGSDTSHGCTDGRDPVMIGPFSCQPHQNSSSDGSLVARGNDSDGNVTNCDFSSCTWRLPLSSGKVHPPAYKPPPPHPHSGWLPSPSDPPPYREPPPAPTQKLVPSSVYVGGRQHSSSKQASPAKKAFQQQTVRPPCYSPPPTQRVPHLSRHSSKTPLSNTTAKPSGTLAAQQTCENNREMALDFVSGLPVDIQDLFMLVTAQQSTLQTQQMNILQCEAEEAGFHEHEAHRTVGNIEERSGNNDFDVYAHQLVPGGSQLTLVLSEVKRLEELSLRNNEELNLLNFERARLSQLATSEGGGSIRTEIMQLRQRLAGTDVELQRTNTTLKLLGKEMKDMSLEKSRDKEHELAQEMERLQSEIKMLRKTSEDSANISQQLNKDVNEVESRISQKKSEVELLIKEMRDANVESLGISPTEGERHFLDGSVKPETSRKIMTSPRQLENAVATDKNPQGVWV